MCDSPICISKWSNWSILVEIQKQIQNWGEQVKENIQENTATEQVKQEKEHSEIGESTQVAQDKAENARTEIDLLQEILKELKKQNGNK